MRKLTATASVQAYIAAMPGWKHLDALVVRTVPNVCKALAIPLHQGPADGVRTLEAHGQRLQAISRDNAVALLPRLKS